MRDIYELLAAPQKFEKEERKSCRNLREHAAQSGAMHARTPHECLREEALQETRKKCAQILCRDAPSWKGKNMKEEGGGEAEGDPFPARWSLAGSQ